MKNFYDLFLQDDGFRDEYKSKGDGYLDALGRVYDLMTNNGWCQSDDEEEKGVPTRLTFNDVFETPDATRFIPRVVQYIVREAIEPNLLVIPYLFQEVRITTGGKMIEIGAIGSMYAGEVSEGHEPPRRNLDLDGGDMVSVTVKKHGIMFDVTDEVIRDSQWDVLNLWLRAAGRALARHKEEQALKLFNEMGITIFNNDQSAEDGEIGACTGRGIDGVPNGSMTLADLMNMWIWGTMRGFTMDTILMNPLSWGMFATDPEVREIVLSGATPTTPRVPSGSGFTGWPTGHGGLGLRTGATGTIGSGAEAALGGQHLPVSSPWVAQLSPFNATYNIAPRGLGTIRVLISPFVPFSNAVSLGDSTTKPTASIIMVDSSNAGLLVVRDPITMTDWSDKARDIQSVKLIERYGMNAVEQGKGVSVARNVVIARNYVADNTNPWSNVTEINQRATKPSGTTY